MATPRIPGTDPDALELACGERAALTTFDLGMRDYRCPCGDTHAVVMDVHPPSRFFPEAVIAVLQETVEPTDGEAFGTRHLMGMALEEFPEAVASANVSEHGQLGCQHLWVFAFDSRRLHVVLVDLVLELMEHAMSHAEDATAQSDFTEALASFDVEEFVDRYRESRDLDRPV